MIRITRGFVLLKMIKGIAAKIIISFVKNNIKCVVFILSLFKRIGILNYAFKLKFSLLQFRQIYMIFYLLGYIIHSHALIPL